MDQITTTYVTLLKTDSNLINVHFFNDVTIDIKEMDEILALIEKLSEGKSYRLLWVLNEFTYFTMEALLIRIEHNQTIKNKIIAEAIIVKSIQNRLLENHYLNKNKNYYPIMIFKNNLPGEIWVKNIKEFEFYINPN